MTDVSTAASVLRHEDLFHTGIVVDDLATAKDEVGAVLGLTWREGGAEIALLTDAEGGGTEVQMVETAYVISREGPHRVELVQSIPDTLWAAAAPGETHHLGWFVDDLTAAATALVDLGSTHVGTIALSADVPPMCAYYRLPGGLCVEIVDRAFRRVLLGREEPTT